MPVTVAAPTPPSSSEDPPPVADAAGGESGWDDEFLAAVAEIAGDADDATWDLLEDFACDFHMNFCVVLYRELERRIADLVVTGLTEDGKHELLERRSAELLAQELYLPAELGTNLLREYFVLGLRTLWDIPEDADESNR